MEAIIEKKAPRRGAMWGARMFRLKCRKLMYFRRTVKDYNSAHERDAKLNLDLTYLMSISLDSKTPNLVLLRHPKQDLALRFPDTKTYRAWLKVFCAFGITSSRKVDTPLPSNFSHALYIILHALHTPQMLSTEGPFRVPGKKKAKKSLYHKLLYASDASMIDMTEYREVHTLCATLSELLSNLPSCLFGESRISLLIDTLHNLAPQLSPQQLSPSVTTELTSDADLLKLQSTPRNTTPKSEPSLNDEPIPLHIDHDVSILDNDRVLQPLRRCLIDTLNETSSEYRLLSLLFYLLHNITTHENVTRMNADNLTQTVSQLLESRIFLNKTDVANTFRSKALVKTCIFHAEILFPIPQFGVFDIVLPTPFETKMISVHSDDNSPTTTTWGKIQAFRNKKKRSSSDIAKRRTRMAALQSTATIKLGPTTSQHSTRISQTKSFDASGTPIPLKNRSDGLLVLRKASSLPKKPQLIGDESLIVQSVPTVPKQRPSLPNTTLERAHTDNIGYRRQQLLPEDTTLQIDTLKSNTLFGPSIDVVAQDADIADSDDGLESFSRQRSITERMGRSRDVRYMAYKSVEEAIANFDICSTEEKSDLISMDSVSNLLTSDDSCLRVAIESSLSRSKTPDPHQMSRASLRRDRSATEGGGLSVSIPSKEEKSVSSKRRNGTDMAYAE